MDVSRITPKNAGGRLRHPTGARQGFCLPPVRNSGRTPFSGQRKSVCFLFFHEQWLPMQVSPTGDVYSAREIALAAGVAEADVVALIGPRRHVPYQEALRVGQALMSRRASHVFSGRTSSAITLRAPGALDHRSSRPDRCHPRNGIMDERPDRYDARHPGPGGTDSAGVSGSATPGTGRWWWRRRTPAESAGSESASRGSAKTPESTSGPEADSAKARPARRRPVACGRGAHRRGSRRLAKPNRRAAQTRSRNPRAVAQVVATARVPVPARGSAKATDAASGPALVAEWAAGPIAPEAASSRHGFFTR